MRAFGLFLSLIILANSGHANELKPFTTDGCSLWIDGTLAQPNLWRHCCVAHDLDYWKGGSEAQRKQSDDNILACVKAAQGPGMADYMYKNVRWGGSPYWINYYRWGYGWNYLDGLWPRGYKEPTAEEQQQIARLLPAAQQLIQADALAHPALADPLLADPAPITPTFDSAAAPTSNTAGNAARSIDAANTSSTSPK
ncbi:MAG TPA: helicase [Cellvibrio sp.]|nr:helicase [Cellvibrio sp.]